MAYIPYQKKEEGHEGRGGRGGNSPLSLTRPQLKCRQPHRVLRTGMWTE